MATQQTRTSPDFVDKLLYSVIYLYKQLLYHANLDYLLQYMCLHIYATTHACLVNSSKRRSSIYIHVRMLACCFPVSCFFLIANAGIYVPQHIYKQVCFDKVGAYVYGSIVRILINSSLNLSQVNKKVFVVNNKYIPSYHRIVI